jgi:hypothetical protein
VTRLPDALHAAWYSNRLGAHPDGLARKEILVTRSLDGVSWSAPVAATDSRAWSFYPSLARTPAGPFHLAWMRWHLLPEGCIYFDSAHCPGNPGCCTGTDRRIRHAASLDGLAWSEASAAEIAHGPMDELPSLVATSDGRLLVYFVSGYRAGDTRKRIHVAVHDGTSWAPPVPIAGLDPGDTDSDTFPHVAERGPGDFLMAFTRYDAAQGENYLHPSAETMSSTSQDGIGWTTPEVKSGPSPAKTDVFPWLWGDGRGGWSVLWVNEDGVTSLPVDGDFPADATSLAIPGYTPRLVPTPTPGIFWAAWVEGGEPTQKVKHRFLAR